MTFRCEQCAAPLPSPTPGFALTTCRQCGTTQHLKTPVPSESLADPAEVAPPPGFQVKEEKDGLRIGWNHLSLTPLLVALFMLPMFALRAPELVTVVRQPGPALALGGVALLIVYVAVASSINITWVEIRGQALSLVTRPLPLPRFGAVDTRTVSGVYCRTRENRVARHFTETRHAVYLRTQAGEVLCIADNLPTEFDAQWLVTRLSDHLGVKNEGRL